MMDKRLNDYLDKVEKILKQLPAAERVDIVREIKSEMLELVEHGLSPEQVLERLGDPRKLAKAYLGVAITESAQFSWRKLGAVISFYGYAGLGGMILLPTTSVIAVAFMISGVLCPIAGTLRLMLFLLGRDIPQIGVSIGRYSLGAVPTFFAYILVGVLLFLAGWGCWKLTLWFIRSVSRRKRGLNQLGTA